MEGFDWVSSLVRRPGIDIQKLTAGGEEVVIIKGRKMVVLSRRGEADFSRVPPGRVGKLLERIRSEDPRVEETTI